MSLVILSTKAGADDWDMNTGQDLPPVPEENRIIKWCKKDGAGVRYASANLEIPGYEPCGKLEVEMTCDAGGGRHIGSAVAGQYGNRDCALGPRIFIERTDSAEPQDLNQPSDVEVSGEASGEVGGKNTSQDENEIANDQEAVTPEQTAEDSFVDDPSEAQESQLKESEKAPKKLTAQEKRNLEREVKELEKQQLSEEKMIEQLLISGILGTGMTPPPRSGKRSNAYQAKQQRKEMEKMLNGLDPESKKILEKMFGVKDIKDVLKPRR